ncbi:MAG TPA: outer membrane beta-barrel protein [Granulicella sp.]
MKKTMLMCALILSSMMAFGQESRQDISASAFGLISPDVTGNAVHKSATMSVGFLGSYRYLLTPRSGLEVNFGYAQNSNKFKTSFIPDGRIHTRQMEFTGAYVYNRTYGRFNPFAEVGVGAMFFSPIKDFLTNNLDAKSTTSLGGLFGAGVAYEVSPSFDIRVQYRGFLLKTPDFNVVNSDFKTNRWEVISTPAVGVAYHF